MTSKRAPVIVAALLMVAFFAWILSQMAPHGPRDGELLIRLAIGMGLAVFGTALVFGLIRLFSGRGRHPR